MTAEAAVDRFMEPAATIEKIRELEFQISSNKLVSTFLQTLFAAGSFRTLGLNKEKYADSMSKTEKLALMKKVFEARVCQISSVGAQGRRQRLDERSRKNLVRDLISKFENMALECEITDLETQVLRLDPKSVMDFLKFFGLEQNPVEHSPWIDMPDLVRKVFDLQRSKLAEGQRLNVNEFSDILLEFPDQTIIENPAIDVSTLSPCSSTPLNSEKISPSVFGHRLSNVKASCRSSFFTSPALRNNARVCRQENRLAVEYNKNIECSSDIAQLKAIVALLPEGLTNIVGGNANQRFNFRRDIDVDQAAAWTISDLELFLKSTIKAPIFVNGNFNIGEEDKYQLNTIIVWVLEMLLNQFFSTIELETRNPSNNPILGESLHAIRVGGNVRVFSKPVLVRKFVNNRICHENNCLEQSSKISDYGHISDGNLEICTTPMYIDSTKLFCSTFVKVICMYAKENTEQCVIEKSVFGESYSHRYAEDFLISIEGGEVIRRRCFLNKVDRIALINSFYSDGDKLFEFLRSKPAVLYLGVFNLFAVAFIVIRLALFVKSKFTKYFKSKETKRNEKAADKIRLDNIERLYQLSPAEIAPLRPIEALS